MLKKVLLVIAFFVAVGTTGVISAETGNIKQLVTGSIYASVASGPFMFAVSMLMHAVDRGPTREIVWRVAEFCGGAMLAVVAAVPAVRALNAFGCILYGPESD